MIAFEFTVLLTIVVQCLATNTLQPSKMESYYAERYSDRVETKQINSACDLISSKKDGSGYFLSFDNCCQLKNPASIKMKLGEFKEFFSKYFVDAPTMNRFGGCGDVVNKIFNEFLDSEKFATHCTDDLLPKFAYRLSNYTIHKSIRTKVLRDLKVLKGQMQACVDYQLLNGITQTMDATRRYLQHEVIRLQSESTESGLKAAALTVKLGLQSLALADVFGKSGELIDIAETSLDLGATMRDIISYGEESMFVKQTVDKLPSLNDVRPLIYVIKMISTIQK